MTLGRRIALFTVLVCLSGCGQAAATVGSASQLNVIPTRTQSSLSTPMVTTAPMDSATKTITRTSTPWPTRTLTPGPPPDMELRDVSIYPNTFNKASQTYFFLGRVKNNTDKIMTFSTYDVIFAMTFDVWEYNSDIYANEYRHVQFTEKLELYEGYYSRMNCILYPGEEGYFTYSTSSGKSEYILRETKKDYSGPLGVWFTYQGYYRTDPKLPLYYHPGTENLEFTKEDGVLEFDYDIVNIPNLLDRSHMSQVYSWLVLLDREGKIINILRKRLAEMPGLKYGGNFHVHSSTAVPPEAYEYFHAFMEMTPEMIEQTDHLEVLNEFQESDTCKKVSL